MQRHLASTKPFADFVRDAIFDAGLALDGQVESLFDNDLDYDEPQVLVTCQTSAQHDFGHAYRLDS